MRLLLCILSMKKMEKNMFWAERFRTYIAILVMIVLTFRRRQFVNSLTDERAGLYKFSMHEKHRINIIY